MALKSAWNRKQTAMVMLSKIKECTITQNTYDKNYSVRGWYNKENSFSFGDDFATLPEAQKFLADLGRKI